MALYEKQFVKPYPDGYVDKPQKTTPVTAYILNMQDKTFQALENFLTSEDVNFKSALTAGYRTSGEKGAPSIVVGSGLASEFASCAIGQYAQATKSASFAMGQYVTASGFCSHVTGSGATASGDYSHAEGGGTTASGNCAHAEGSATIAAGNAQHVQGTYNIEDTENKYAHIVGGGTSNTDRKNIHTLDRQGNAWYAGDVTNGNGVSLDGLMALIGTTDQLRTIVQTLPEEDISTNTIYMVPRDNPNGNNVYDEYINIDGTPSGWEPIGDSSVDLSNYYTKTQTEQLLSGYVQVETGKGLSSNDYTDSEKQLVESIMNMTTEGALAILNREVA